MYLSVSFLLLGLVGVLWAQDDLGLDGLRGSSSLGNLGSLGGGSFSPTVCRYFCRPGRCPRGYRCQYSSCGSQCVPRFGGGGGGGGGGGQCPPWLPQTPCIRNPCDGAYCPRYPYAQCRPYYCGGCSARFYVGFRRVNCYGYGPFGGSRLAGSTLGDSGLGVSGLDDSGFNSLNPQVTLG